MFDRVSHSTQPLPVGQAHDPAPLDPRVERQQQCRGTLEHYLTVPNGTLFGPAKQAVLNAMTGLDLTPEQAQLIRNSLGREALQHDVGDGNDIALVVAVMRKLRQDHHSTLSKPNKLPRAYDEAARCLTQLARHEQPTVSPKGFLGLKKHHYFGLAPGSKPTKATVRQIVQAQGSLAYLDVSDLDLSDVDLTQTEMAGTLMRRTKLNVPSLQHAIDCRAMLHGADLSGLDLRRVNWRFADVSGVILWRARVNGADVTFLNRGFANLRGVDVREQDLRGADVEGADLQDAVLADAEVDGPVLQRAIVCGAITTRVQAVGQDLRCLKPQGYELDLREANLKHSDLRGVDFRHCQVCLRHAELEGANFEGALMNGDGLEEFLAVGANLTGANFYGRDLRRVPLPAGLDWPIVLRKARLEHAYLVGHWLRQVRFQGATFDNDTVILFEFSDNLDLDFNHLNNPSGSFFTAVESIDNEYGTLKRSLMTQVVEELARHDIDSLVEPMLQILLNRPFDYSGVIAGDKAFRDKFLRCLAKKADRSAVPMNNNGLRFFVDRYLSKLSPSELKTFMFQKNNLFIQIIHQGLASKEASTHRLTRELYQNYLAMPRVISVHEKLDQALMGDYRIFTKGEDNFAVSEEYMDKFLYKTHPEYGVQWNEDLVLFKRGVATEIKNIGADVFQDFTVFLNNFAFETKQAKLLRLLELLVLGPDHAAFVAAIGATQSNIKLCEVDAQTRLYQTFDRVYKATGMGALLHGAARAKLELREAHLGAILEAYEMTRADRRTQATLLLLGGIFARFSSSRVFGRELDSPHAVRNYAYGLMKAALATDATLVPGPTFDDWTKRMLGMPGAMHCSGALSDDVIEYCRALPGFNQSFAGVIPPAWQ
ncbi:pentapeptide repeat-containing protein [Pandoraea sputorum]|uniref:pentapeptide repeat-containing protein n=1 Tax=Pandoraea sputorum TaxID=93222 RepID=UPI001241118D|nr:pentapeptide repeat-containing protein [Pandoraea sputorum]VVE59361.1 Secreted effector protein PipB2 [Pandoraea sputorum]